MFYMSYDMCSGSERIRIGSVWRSSTLGARGPPQPVDPDPPLPFYTPRIHTHVLLMYRGGYIRAGKPDIHVHYHALFVRLST